MPEDSEYTADELDEMAENYKAKQQLGYCKRQADKYKRLEKYSLDGDNKAKYGTKAEGWKQKTNEYNQKLKNSIAKSFKNGIIKTDVLIDSASVYIRVTREAIDNVPELDIFHDKRLNKLHKQASQDLLREVYNNKQVKLGTEFSIVYDENMQSIPWYGYRIGKVGSVRIDNPNVKYHAFHNHGSDESFSYDDLYKFVFQNDMISLTVCGNAGSRYVISKTTTRNTDGYKNYLRRKAKEIIYSANGIDYSLDVISDMNKGTISIAPFKKLAYSQRKEIETAIKKVTNECLERAEEYGFEYTYRKTRLAHR